MLRYLCVFVLLDLRRCSSSEVWQSEPKILLLTEEGSMEPFQQVMKSEREMFSHFFVSVGMKKMLVASKEFPSGPFEEKLKCR